MLNEAVGVLVYGMMSLQRDDLEQFKSLRVIVSLGICGANNIDVTAASQLGTLHLGRTDRGIGLPCVVCLSVRTNYL